MERELRTVQQMHPAAVRVVAKGFHSELVRVFYRPPDIRFTELGGRCYSKKIPAPKSAIAGLFLQIRWD